jgi:dihydroorotate dehydrogenase (NAD+) catalytic subunit
MSRPDLAIEIAGMRWANPLTTASGTMSGWDNYAALFPLNTFGALTVKSVTMAPRPGNPAPRLTETASGLINSIGIPNPGLAEFLRYELPKVRGYGVPVIVSIAGHSLDEYIELTERLSQEPGVAALEINMSCPNVGKETMEFGQSPSSAGELMRELRKVSTLPIIPKLTPNCTDPAAIARAVVAEGADAVALINTVVGMAIDIHTGLPKTGMLTGGLSGPAVKPIALRMVWQVAEAVDVPIIGMGGIMNTADALEFIMAGATAVALGTVNFTNHRAAPEILAGLEAFLSTKGFASVAELRGCAHLKWRERDPALERLHL